MLRGRLRELANHRRRFGQRRLFVLLWREGESSGINPVYRLGPRGRTEGAQADSPSQGDWDELPDPDLGAAQHAHLAGSRFADLRFAQNRCAGGQRYCVFNLVGDGPRECLAEISAPPISGRRLVRELTAFIERCGKARMIVHDTGRELTGHAILQ